jgi:hypothetical protein
LKNRASLKAVIHEYKIEEKSMAQAAPFQTIDQNYRMTAILSLPTAA